jgi:hypothetical protein
VSRRVLVLVPLLALAAAAPILSPADGTGRVSLAGRLLAGAAVRDTSFAALVERLSEPGGFFQSDNLVSNEASYQHVLGRMQALGPHGGAYVGVGPDQNFTYIAATRPDIAFIIDIRRDNLLLHLLFKALFEEAANRIEYVALLTGREPPREPRVWEGSPIDDIVAYIDLMPASDAAFERASRLARARMEGYGVPLTEEDHATIRRFHGEFVRWGLDIRYSNRWGGAMGGMPTLRQLLLETDLDGTPRNYLAAEESFRYVKDLQRSDRIIPVVGDLAGPHALAAIGREVARRGTVIRVLYVSNVEQYLMRDDGFARFARTVTGLPYDGHSVLIRSFFSRGWPHPYNRRGYYATQLLETFSDFVTQYEDGGYASYADLVRRNVQPPR